MTGLRVADFDYDLPEELIAQQPPAQRGQSRMLVMDRATGALRDSSFAEFPSLLQPGDLLVLNDSRVIPARLYARRTLRRERMRNPPAASKSCSPSRPGKTSGAPSSGRAERSPSARASSFPRPPAQSSSKPKSWSAASLASGCCASSRSTISSPSSTASATCRCRPTSAATMRPRTASATRPSYSRERGSVAAPTAGLHFTPQILDALAARGVEVARITLHVGLGTFAPLRVERIDEVRLHRERYTLSAAAAEAINRAAARRPPHRRRRHHRGAHTGTLRAAGQRRPTPAALRRNGDLHLPRLQIPPGRRPAHQLPPAAIEPADAGQCLCRARARAGRLPPRGRGEIPLLQLRRLHVLS